MSAASPAVHLAVALDGAGWHPAAWREPRARPAELFTAGYWADLVQEAERGLLDFVTIEDWLGLQSARHVEPDRRTDQVRGRLDAVLIAARVAPLTSHIGLVPTAVVTHTEPFHISKAIATLDYVSTGRAGLRVQVSARPDEAAHFGRRTFPAARPRRPGQPAVQDLVGELFDEAADYVEVVRRLWDSWEDDAEIRDVATGRFIDRGQAALHRLRRRALQRQGAVDHPAAAAGPAGGHRAGPCQRAVPAGRPVGRRRLRHAARRRARRRDRGRDPRRPASSGPRRDTVHVFGDLVVFLDEPGGEPGPSARPASTTSPDTRMPATRTIFAGTPLQAWPTCCRTGRPAGCPGSGCARAPSRTTCDAITRGLVPELQRRGAFRHCLRGSRPCAGCSGCARPANRYATA